MPGLRYSTLAVGLLLLTAFALATGCKREREQGSLFPKDDRKPAASYDFDDIQSAGEIIVGTLSGPDSYYDFNGEPMGKQYALAQHFASAKGLGIRVEVAHSDSELAEKLMQGEIDLAAYQLPLFLIEKYGLHAAGATDSVRHSAWAVNSRTPALERALREWYSPNVEGEIADAERKREENRYVVKRSVRPAFISRERGLISVYDDLFRKGAAVSGLDWRLLAAVCYTESGFDPNAVSGAGARGLMQLMPATARNLGVTDAFSPEQNVDGGARLLKRLVQDFSDIRSPGERLKFALAAYNGGPGHVRDAMALARKYGHSAQDWVQVSEYILLLSQPEYYRDPVVRHGYMVGRETARYVETVAARYEAYGGRIAFAGNTPEHPTEAPGSEQMRRQNNKYTHGTEILPPDDPAFQPPTD
ncbi:MAG: transglycosylase SLT domain-containing protein [Alloprevotella sp.]|nr:transglycosylase SLT domain-containing protein [Alloprevotella sp.]